MQVKDRLSIILHQNFLGKLLISYLHCIESAIMPRLKSDERAIRDNYLAATGRELDLVNPSSFSEKMNWYKINGRLPLMAKCADKVSVRDYVENKGYKDLLNNMIGVYEKVNDIPFELLPDKYVIKAAHGSHMNIIKKQSKPINIFKTKLLLHSWLHQNIYWGEREWVYRDIPKRIIIEDYLEDQSGELRDFKFFCFNGKPTYLQYDGGRYNGKHFRNYYDMSYCFLPLRDDIPSNENEKLSISYDVLDMMKSIAEDLAQPFQFVRVDFYYANGKIYFGELTFFHNGGFTWFKPEIYDAEFGKKWDLVSEK